MTIQTINIGTTANDGTGDPLRTALDKVNDNFTDTTNAASYSVTANTTDTSTGENGQPKVLRVGDAGVLKKIVVDSGSANDLTKTGVIYTVGADVTDTPTTNNKTIIAYEGVTPTTLSPTIKQVMYNTPNTPDNRAFERTRAADGVTWTDWVEILHTGNTGSIVSEDYEEGTWTPTVSSVGGGTSVTYSEQNGRYTKIGNLVTASATITVDTVSSAGASLFRVSLPFTSSSANRYSGSINRILNIPADLSVKGALTPVTLSNQAFAYLYGQQSGSNALSASEVIASGLSFIFTVSYETN